MSTKWKSEGERFTCPVQMSKRVVRVQAESSSGSGTPTITCKCKVSRCTTCLRCSRCGCNHDGIEISVKMGRRAGGTQPSSSHKSRLPAKRRRVSLQSVDASDAVPPAAASFLHDQSSLRHLREAFGISPEDMPAIPNAAQRNAPELEWENIPLRRGLVRFVTKLLVTMCRIACPGNASSLLREISVYIQRSEGHAADFKVLYDLIGNIRTCSEVLPRDSLQRQAMLAPFCYSLSRTQCKVV